MEIKIDTKKDSPEDIRRTIEFLQKLVESSTGGEFNTSGDVSNGMTGLFGGTPVLGTPPDSSDSDDESKDEEEKGDIEILPY